ncbi:hypothetical protein SDC9_119618 [bioreactor metagenome]|uniref:Nbr1 FW domain-containing protein n=1 Tax=bioreactor metagenome TaxID=1076179 RepID=A0A645C4S1_9ZZZZ
MKRVYTLITSIVVLSILISGCIPSGNSEAENLNIVQTSVAETITAMQATSLAAATPTQVIPTETPTTAATNTPENTPIPTQAPTATVTPRPAFLISNVQDVSYPDNTAVTAGKEFTKTWRFTNAGTSTWTSDFKIVFVSGNQMSAATTAIGQTVAPGQTADISLVLTAPTATDTYTGYFMLQSPNGARFGFGDDGNSAFWVKVKVETFFEVTGAKVNIKPKTYTGSCPYTFTVSATITVSAPGTVTYKYVATNKESDLKTLVFSEAGSKTTDEGTWTVTSSGDLEIHIYIDKPNNQAFTVVTVPVTCN